MPSVASLGSVTVMLQTKRRQPGSRVAIEHRNLRLIQQADVVRGTEGNIWEITMGEIAHTAAVSENQSCYTMILRQLGRACVLPVLCKYRVCRTTNTEGRQTGPRQSDSRIVPMKVSNVTGGKPRGVCVSRRPCYARSYQRGNIIYTQR